MKIKAKGEKEEKERKEEKRNKQVYKKKTEKDTEQEQKETRESKRRKKDSGKEIRKKEKEKRTIEESMKTEEDTARTRAIGRTKERKERRKNSAEREERSGKKEESAGGRWRWRAGRVSRRTCQHASPAARLAPRHQEASPGMSRPHLYVTVYSRLLSRRRGNLVRNEAARSLLFYLFPFRLTPCICCVAVAGVGVLVRYYRISKCFDGAALFV